MDNNYCNVRTRRGVSSVVSVILIVAIVVILAATTSAFVLDFTEDLNDPSPNVADTTGEFELDLERTSGTEDQRVRITHLSGEGVPLDELAVLVHANGDGVDRQVRLVNLPPEQSTFDNDSFEGDEDLVSGWGVSGGVLFDGSSVWSAGETIEFRIPTGDGVDFREDGEDLEVTIIHEPSNAILSEHTFTP